MAAKPNRQQPKTWNGHPIESCPYPDHIDAVRRVGECDAWVQFWLILHDGGLPDIGCSSIAIGDDEVDI